MITMKKYNTNRETVRSPLMIGATIIVTSILMGLMFFAAHLRMDTSTMASREVSDVCTTSLMTSTSSTSTTSSTTTTTETTTTTTVTTTTKMTETTTSQMTVVVTEPITEYVEPEVESDSTPEPTPEPIPQPVEEPVMATDLPITEYERVLLTNIVASEYGSDYHGYGGPPITLYERACVVAVVMNRVYNSGFPNTIEGVLTEPHQFSGYYASSSYFSSVTQNCIDAVYYYFAHASEFPYYLSFWGDGAYNHFS